MQMLSVLLVRVVDVVEREKDSTPRVNTQNVPMIVLHIRVVNATIV